MERGARYAMPGTLVTLLGVQYCNNFCYCTQARAGIFVRNLKVTQTPLNQSQRTPTISTRQSQPMFTVSQPSRTPNHTPTNNEMGVTRKRDVVLTRFTATILWKFCLSIRRFVCHTREKCRIEMVFRRNATVGLSYTLCLRVLSLST